MKATLLPFIYSEYRTAQHNLCESPNFDICYICVTMTTHSSTHGFLVFILTTNVQFDSQQNTVYEKFKEH